MPNYCLTFVRLVLYAIVISFRLWKRCGEGCSSGSSIPMDPEVPYFPGGCLPSVGGGSTTGPSSGGFNPAAAGAGGDAAGETGAAAAGSEGLPSGGSIGRGGSLPNPRLSQSSNNSQAASQVGLNKPGVAAR